MTRKIDVPELRDFENAVWCALIRHRSPGDIFRFLHALHLRSQECKKDVRQCCVVCAPDDFDNVWPLLGDSVETLNDVQKWRLAKIQGDKYSNVNWLILKGLSPYTNGFERPIASFLSAWQDAFGTNFSFARGGDIVFTTYSDGRHFNQGYRQAEVTFKRIDWETECRSFPESTACFGQRPIAKWCRSEPAHIAVVLRCASDWRSTPGAWFSKAFYDRLTKCLPAGASFDFFGLSESIYDSWPRWLRLEQCSPYSGESLSSQIDKARHYHLAIGVNSSALDVFSIAGVPVLRDCEFQAHPERGWPFKHRYNSFLAGTLNVGLGITAAAYKYAEQPDDWSNEDWFIRSFAAMTNQLAVLADPAWGGAPRHAHIEFESGDDVVESMINAALSH